MTVCILCMHAHTQTHTLTQTHTHTHTHTHRGTLPIFNSCGRIPAIADIWALTY
jgi:hypothetical protein